MSKKTKPNTIKLLRNEPYELSDIVRADIIERMNSNLVKTICDNMVRVNGMMSKVQSNIDKVEELKSRIGETFPIEEVRETHRRFQKVYKELMDLAIEIDCAVLKDLKQSHNEVDEWGVPKILNFRALLENDIIDGVLNRDEMDIVGFGLGKIFQDRIRAINNDTNQGIKFGKTKPTGGNPANAKRNKAIRKRASKMTKQGMKASHIYKTIAEDYDNLEPSTIATIVTKHNY